LYCIARWTQDVALQKAVGYGSAILVDETIYSFGVIGNENDISYWPIHRIDIDTGFSIGTVDAIADQGGNFAYPILLEVDANVCP